MRRESVLPYVWMLCGSVSFAIMGTLAHSLSGMCDWPVVALARAGLPLLLALGLAFVGRVKLVFWRPGTLWMRSIAGSLAVVCTFYALSKLHTEDVFALSNMFPIWVALLSWPLLGEAPSIAVWLAVGSGVAGVFLILRPDTGGVNLTALFALASSFFSAIAMLGLHRLRYIDARAIVVHFSAVALVFAVVSLFVFSSPAKLSDALQGGCGLTLLGIGVTATIGQLFLTKAFAAGEPAKVSVVGLTQIVFALIFGELVSLHELHLFTVLGIALVMAPTAWIMLRRKPGDPAPEG